jgi:putative ATPase
MVDLFADQLIAPPPVPESGGANAPLADRLRPSSLAEIVGQEHLTGPDGAIGRLVAA